MSDEGRGSKGWEWQLVITLSVSCSLPHPLRFSLRLHDVHDFGTCVWQMVAEVSERTDFMACKAVAPKSILLVWMVVRMSLHNFCQLEAKKED